MLRAKAISNCTLSAANSGIRNSGIYDDLWFPEQGCGDKGNTLNDSSYKQASIRVSLVCHARSLFQTFESNIGASHWLTMYKTHTNAWWILLRPQNRQNKIYQHIINIFRYILCTKHCQCHIKSSHPHYSFLLIFITISIIVTTSIAEDFRSRFDTSIYQLIDEIPTKPQEQELVAYDSASSDSFRTNAAEGTKSSSWFQDDSGF